MMEQIDWPALTSALTAAFTALTALLVTLNMILQHYAHALTQKKADNIEAKIDEKAVTIEAKVDRNTAKLEENTAITKDVAEKVGEG